MCTSMRVANEGKMDIHNYTIAELRKMGEKDAMKPRGLKKDYKVLFEPHQKTYEPCKIGGEINYTIEIDGIMSILHLYEAYSLE